MVNQSRKRDHIMPKLNKSQKYAIQWLHSTGLSVDGIATELNLNTDQVSSIVSQIEPKPQKIDTKSVSAKDLMITHTSGKKINSVAIMTKEASEVADEIKKKMPVIRNDDRKGIFRPKK